LSTNISSMKVSIIPILFLFVFMLITYNAQALLRTTSPSIPESTTTLNKADIESMLGRKLKAKEKLSLWFIRKRINKAQRRNLRLLKNNQSPPDTSKCATILFTSGTQLKANIIEISESSVKFVRCGQTDTLSFSKRDIDKVTLHDGIRIYQNNSNYSSKKPRHFRPNNRLSFVAVLLGFAAIPLIAINAQVAIIFAVFAIFLGLVAIGSRNNRYKKIAGFGAGVGFSALVVRLIQNNND